MGCSDWVRYFGLSKSALEESSPFNIRHCFAVIFIAMNCLPAIVVHMYSVVLFFFLLIVLLVFPSMTAF